MNHAARELLAAGVKELNLSLSPQQLGDLNRLGEELKKWNRKINLTAITDDEGIALKHLVDSLTLLKVVRAPGRLLDIGSGGGFPGLPIKIAEPGLEIVTVDAVAKKISFQKQAVRLLSLTHFLPLHVRAEELAADYPRSFDWIVSRAFSDLPTFVGLALPLLKKDGRIVAMKGPTGRGEADDAAGALTQLGAHLMDLQEFSLPGSNERRSLLVFGIKVAD